MKVDRIDENSEYLPSVIELWRRNSNTLGFFPEGAFQEHAAKQCILVARGDQSNLLGYLLFRVVWRGRTLPQATIVHLCVNEGHRLTGVARALIGELQALTQAAFLSIEVSCRRDYAANKLWPKLGFTYAHEKTGRSGHPVITWQMNLRPLPLMALLQQKVSENRLPAVMDANVLYRLQDPLPESEPAAKTLSEEAKALQEDWLSSDIALLITDETFNEIQKNDDSRARASRLRFAQRYQRIVTRLEDVGKAERVLQPLFPDSPTESTRSDVRQLAHAIAGDSRFFITQDNGLLKKNDEVLSRFGVSILSPGELVGRIDEMIREAEYCPGRLAGSLVTTSKMPSDQIAALYSHFGRPQQKERKRQFEGRLRAFVAQPSTFEILVSWQADRTPLSLIVYDRASSDELVVPMLRVSRSPLSGTVLRYLISQAVLTAAQEGRSVARVAVDGCGEELGQALAEIGFAQVDAQWVKINLAAADTSASLLEQLSQLGERCEFAAALVQTIVPALSEAAETQDALALAEIERRLWPAKILDADIPTFVVSIRPVWAQHLFDEEIARQTLWGAREELVFRNEKVYYRSKRNSRNIRSPARILWYVVKDKRIPASMHVRACSLLSEVVVGKPKDLFRRFRRLGVYEWDDVLRIAGGRLEERIMALRFTNTELFRSPVSLKVLTEVMRAVEGRRPILQSPQPISSASFANIYTMGTCNDA